MTHSAPAATWILNLWKKRSNCSPPRSRTRSHSCHPGPLSLSQVPLAPPPSHVGSPPPQPARAPPSRVVSAPLQPALAPPHAGAAPLHPCALLQPSLRRPHELL